MDTVYPETRTEDSVDAVAGLAFENTYRWLESTTEEVQQWQAAQNRLADKYVRSWPYYEMAKTSVSNYLIGRISMLPICVGGQWFRLDTMDDKHVVIVADTPYGLGPVIYSVGQENRGDPTSIIWLSPSPDGCILALGVCIDGSENNTIRLINVGTGRCIPNPPPHLLMDGWTGGARWLSDSSGFYFQALIGNPADFRQQVLFHSIVDKTQTLINLPQQDPDGHQYILMMMSTDGQYHIAYQGLSVAHPIAILDTHHAAPEWKAFNVERDCLLIGHIIGDCLIAVTDVDAPRGRVVSIPLQSSTCDNPQSWVELISESDAVIRSITPVGAHLYVTELIDTYSRVRIFDQQGGLMGEVTLPGKGGIADEVLFPITKLALCGFSGTFIFSFSTMTQSWGVYSHCLSQDRLEELRAPKITIENAIVEDRWAVSEDGTQIPYHSLRLTTTDNTIPQPTLIYAYGGYSSARPPEYPNAIMAFVEAGGIYILGNIRGGSEFGREWWEKGRMNNKQNSYKDLYAIAEDLITKNLTTSDLLAVNGASNGGLMSGVAVTQRPDLWRAAILQVPVLDLVGTFKHSYGRFCTQIEYADPENPDEILNMVEYSALHLIRDGIKYPAVLLSAGATDPRCPPWHARKFAARLQSANSGDYPVLLHVWEDSGHGQATSREILVAQYTEWITFLMRQLGMTP